MCWPLWTKKWSERQRLGVKPLFSYPLYGILETSRLGPVSFLRDYPLFPRTPNTPELKFSSMIHVPLSQPPFSSSPSQTQALLPTGIGSRISLQIQPKPEGIQPLPRGGLYTKQVTRSLCHPWKVAQPPLPRPCSSSVPEANCSGAEGRGPKRVCHKQILCGIF